MNKDQLFEMASLDALGLLDAEERRAFDAAFQDASPALREQLRSEQRRLTDIKASLPDVQPPASLRERVLLAVRDAIVSMSPAHANTVIARIGAHEWPVRRSVSPLWRAACLGFATATVVLIAVGFSIRDMYSKGLKDFYDSEITQLVSRDLGSEFVDQFFDLNVHHVAFRPSEQGGGAQAVILINSELEMAYLATRNLPRVDGKYRLAIVDSNGDVQRVLASFEADGQLNGMPIKAAIELGAAMAIIPPAARATRAAPLLRTL